MKGVVGRARGLATLNVPSCPCLPLHRDQNECIAAGIVHALASLQHVADSLPPENCCSKRRGTHEDLHMRMEASQCAGIRLPR